MSDVTNAAMARSSDRSEARRVGSRGVLLSALLLGILHLFVLPPWMGEDEPWQLEYVHHVADGHLPLRRGPMWSYPELRVHPAGALWGVRHLSGLSVEQVVETQAELLASMRANDFPGRVDHDPHHADPRTLDEAQGGDPHYHSFNQPPLYYLLCGALVAATGVSDVEAELHVARSLSLLCYLAVVALAIGIGRLASSDERVATVAGVVAAWLPMHARQAAVVNNDVLVKVFAGLVLLLAVRLAMGRGGLRDAVLALACLGAGLFTKTTAAGGVAVIAVAILLSPRVPRRARAIALGAGLAVAAAGVGYWLRTHNSAIPLTGERFLERLSKGASAASWRNLLVTTVGTTNWEARLLPEWAYRVVGGVGVAALVSGVARCARPGARLSRRALCVCVVALLAQFLLLVGHGEARGRYVFPVLPALAVLAAVGVLALVPERRRASVPLAVAIAFALYEGAYLWGALVVQHYEVVGA